MPLPASSSPRLLLFGLLCAAISSGVWLVNDAAVAQTFPSAPQAESSDVPNWDFNSPTTAPTNTEVLATEPAPLVRVAKPNVLIVSIDGCRPDCLLRADAPNLRSLMSHGSFTMWARTTDIAITLPSHVSMLTGVKPERHGINFNDDGPPEAHILVPSLFDMAKERGISTGMASGKRKFLMFTKTHHVDFSAVAKTVTGPDASVGSWAEQIITRDRPRLMFVHFAGADVAGHGIGWGTPEQIDAISNIDKQIGIVLAAYKKAGLADDTYFIISADHGGTARSHGPDEPRSHFIPWILAGPGVRENCDLTRFGKAFDIATFDTFATAAYILGIPVPSDSDGKPILAAFSDFDMLKMSTESASWAPTSTSATLKKPTSRPAEPAVAPPVATTPMLTPATEPTTRP